MDLDLDLDLDLDVDVYSLEGHKPCLCGIWHALFVPAEAVTPSRSMSTSKSTIEILGVSRQKLDRPGADMRSPSTCTMLHATCYIRHSCIIMRGLCADAKIACEARLASQGPGGNA